ncbi:MAG: GspE/PulE family protein [Bacillota bacterium]
MKAGGRKKYLGTLLVEAGVITREQLQQALQRHETPEGRKKFIGQLLVEMGFCREEDVARVLAALAGVPFLSLQNYPVDEKALRLLPPDAARRLRALPVGFSGGRLLVAMQHPGNVIAIDDLRLLTGHDIQPVVIPDSELEETLERARQLLPEDAAAPAAVQDEEAVDVLALEEAASGEDKPAVSLFNRIMQQAVLARASDVHIEALEREGRVRLRIDGVLHDSLRLPRQIYPALVSRVKVLAGMDIAERRVPQDGRASLRVEGRTVDVRVASLPSVYGEKLTLRLLERSGRLIGLEELGFPPAVLESYRRLIRLPYGFILVTGPTGSGKSTTLYATLASLNAADKNIITVEDPVEYRLEGVNHVQINPRAGLSFAAGLRSILRHDPDIIMVGEIRDRETARIAVESALTGHLVFSTLHTNDAAGAVGRLGDMGIEPFLIASSLVGVVAQRLLRLLCPYCKEEYPVSAAQWGETTGQEPGEEFSGRLYRPRGCLRCGNTGYRGRLGVYELLVVDEGMQRLILERRSAREMRETAVRDGMVTMWRDGLAKAAAGLTSLEEVMRVLV